jgi:1-acyl-sn-glycerol-3-phosphate acyltransferase
MSVPVVPSCVPRTKHKISSAIAQKALSLTGWHITGEVPEQKKFLLAVAPHTSNWDFFLGIAVMLSLNLKVTFLGKKSIFIGPSGYLLRRLGGIAIDRKHRHGVVGQMVEEFNQQDAMILGLAPEGTRSKTRQWKTGFLHIAQQAQVPIVPVGLDFKKKEIKLMPAQLIKGDIESELLHFKHLFNDVCAKNPQSV